MATGVREGRVRIALAGAAVAILVVGTPRSGSAQQGVPNFSGVWVNVPGTSQPPQLPSVGPIRITQGRATVSITAGRVATTAIYRLDGIPTENTRMSGGQARKVTSTARWTSAKLVVTDQDTLWKHETTYSFDESGSGLLVVVSSSTGLYERGALTVGTIGPFTRIYRRH